MRIDEDTVYKVIQLTPQYRLFSGRLHQVPKLPIILNYLYLQVSSLFF